MGRRVEDISGLLVKGMVAYERNPNTGLWILHCQTCHSEQECRLDMIKRGTVICHSCNPSGRSKRNGTWKYTPKQIADVACKHLKISKEEFIDLLKEECKRD